MDVSFSSFVLAFDYIYHWLILHGHRPSAPQDLLVSCDQHRLRTFSPGDNKEEWIDQCDAWRDKISAEAQNANERITSNAYLEVCFEIPDHPIEGHRKDVAETSDHCILVAVSRDHDGEKVLLNVKRNPLLQFAHSKVKRRAALHGLSNRTLADHFATWSPDVLVEAPLFISDPTVNLEVRLENAIDANSQWVSSEPAESCSSDAKEISAFDPHSKMVELISEYIEQFANPSNRLVFGIQDRTSKVVGSGLLRSPEDKDVREWEKFLKESILFPLFKRLREAYPPPPALNWKFRIWPVNSNGTNAVPPQGKGKHDRIVLMVPLGTAIGEAPEFKAFLSSIQQQTDDSKVDKAKVQLLSSALEEVQTAKPLAKDKYFQNFTLQRLVRKRESVETTSFTISLVPARYVVEVTWSTQGDGATGRCLPVVKPIEDGPNNRRFRAAHPLYMCFRLQESEIASAWRRKIDSIVSDESTTVLVDDQAICGVIPAAIACEDTDTIAKTITTIRTQSQNERFVVFAREIFKADAKTTIVLYGNTFDSVQHDSSAKKSAARVLACPVQNLCEDLHWHARYAIRTPSTTSSQHVLFIRQGEPCAQEDEQAKQFAAGNGSVLTVQGAGTVPEVCPRWRMEQVEQLREALRGATKRAGLISVPRQKGTMKIGLSTGIKQALWHARSIFDACVEVDHLQDVNLSGVSPDASILVFVKAVDVKTDEDVEGVKHVLNRSKTVVVWETSTPVLRPGQGGKQSIHFPSRLDDADARSRLKDFFSSWASEEQLDELERLMSQPPSNGETFWRHMSQFSRLANGGDISLTRDWQIQVPTDPTKQVAVQRLLLAFSFIIDFEGKDVPHELLTTGCFVGTGDNRSWKPLHRHFALCLLRSNFLEFSMKSDNTFSQPDEASDSVVRAFLCTDKAAELFRRALTERAAEDDMFSPLVATFYKTDPNRAANFVGAVRSKLKSARLLDDNSNDHYLLLQSRILLYAAERDAPSTRESYLQAAEELLRTMSNPWMQSRQLGILTAIRTKNDEEIQEAFRVALQGGDVTEKKESKNALEKCLEVCKNGGFYWKRKLPNLGFF